MDILETNSRYRKSSLSNKIQIPEVIKYHQKKVLCVRSTVPKLLPFLMTACNYFVLWIPLSEPSWYSALIKCLPIICLKFFIVVHSIGSRKFSSYAKKIFLGLVFSAAGDVCLVWPEYFQLGMVMFGLAHILYTIAFGFHPLNIRIFIIFALFCATFYSLTVSYLSGPFIYMVAGYSMLISTMAWRALSKLVSHEFSWANMSAALGAISFMISDCVLAVDKFCFPFSNARAIVMSTYYGAQMLISLSTIRPTQDDYLWKSR